MDNENNNKGSALSEMLTWELQEAMGKLPRRYWVTALDDLDVDAHNRLAIDTARAYVTGEVECPPALLGSVGVGKTSVLCATFNEILYRRAFGEHKIPRMDYLASIDEYLSLHNRRIGMSKNELRDWDEHLETIMWTEHLFIDDFSRVEEPSPWQLGIVNRIVDHRYAHELPLVIAANHDLPVIGEIWGARVEDRLRAMCQPVFLDGPSRRRAAQTSIINPNEANHERHHSTI